MNYLMNEASFDLPDLVGLVDRSRQFLEVKLEDGVQIDLVIARAPMPQDQDLHAAVEAGLADQRRSLRGFTVISAKEREYAELVGIEVRVRFIDKKDGPIFHHEFHTTIDAQRIGFHAICAVTNADACDAWMARLLEGVKLRDYE
jgi:hypothetical protein